jgi:diguanylate cyclase (GGDEF)-like protein
LDLDNFKHINDSLGHEVGDQLLSEIGSTLKTLVRTVDTAARLGGDEFAVLLEDTPEEGATEVAQRLLSALERPVRIGGRDLYVGASIGVAVADTGEQTVSDLLRNADLAMYVAKGRGKGTYAVFQPDMYSASLETLSLTTDFRKAVESNELLLFYQPIVDLRTGEVRALEALARWQHPVRGLLAPAEFITMAEDSGLIVDMGRHLLFKACVQAQDWRKAFSPKIKVGFNLSARQLQEPDVASMVRDALDVSGLPADSLVLEITESLLVGNVSAIVARLTELRDLGVCIAIDDFGTGHSSLALLKHLPLDFMKIDRAFVQSLTDSSQDISFVHAILNLASSLQLKTLGEGIETEAQKDVLLDLSCTTGQGYLFAKPMDAGAMELYLGGKFLGESTTQPVEPSLDALGSV